MGGLESQRLWTGQDDGGAAKYSPSVAWKPGSFTNEGGVSSSADRGSVSSQNHARPSREAPLNRVLHIGAGGWDYLASGGDRLRAYARLFDFAEVNATFYHLPRLSTVRSWRRRAPPGFTFAVKCNRRATHDLSLRAEEETYRVLERMAEAMRLLRSWMLVLQTPPSLPLDTVKVREVGELIRGAALGGVSVFWEARTPLNPGKLRGVRTEMIRTGVTPVVDLGREAPVEGAHALYSRLFGSAPLTDESLRLIDERVRLSGSEVVVLSFHGAAMYKDAHRFKTLKGQ